MEDGRVIYIVSTPLLENGGSIYVRQEDVLHIKNLTLNGWVGLSPIAILSESVGLSIATQENAAKLFGNGSNVSGAIEYPDALSPEAAKRLAESWRQAYSGVSNSGKVAVLEGGAKFSKISLTGDESQALESRKFQIEEIARAFRIPPHKLYSLDNAHYDQLENQEMVYHNDTLRPFSNQFEEQCRLKLLMPNERKMGIAIKFDYDSITYNDTNTRYKNYAIGIQNGWLSINDVLRTDGKPDIGSEGDTHRVSLSTTPATNNKDESKNDAGNPPQEDIYSDNKDE